MTLTQLQAKVRYLMGDITSTNYSDTNLNRALNDYYHKAIAKAIVSNGQWEVNGEIATADIVAGQQEYVFPSDLVALKQIEANLTSGKQENNWNKLKIIDRRSRTDALTNYIDTTDTTTAAYEVDVYDKSFFIEDGLPEFSVTGGLKIYYNKEATELSSGSDEPYLAEHLQMYLVHGACLDYSIRINDEAAINRFRNLLLENELNIKEYYTNRLPAVKPALRTRKECYN